MKERKDSKAIRSQSKLLGSKGGTRPIVNSRMYFLILEKFLNAQKKDFPVKRKVFLICIIN